MLHSLSRAAMRIVAHCLVVTSSLLLGQSAQPPASPVAIPRFELASSGLEWRERANPTRYIDAIGRRAAIFGKQDGKFEAWIWPIKVLHGFRLEFKLDDQPEPVRAENYLQDVIVRPESTTLVYVHPSFTVKQIIWAPHDRAAIVQFFDVNSDRPLSITAKFVPDFKPMWPASLGGQHTSWLADEKAFALTDGTGKPTALIGTPSVSAFTEFMDHSLVGGEMLLRIDTTPEQAKRSLYPLVVSMSLEGQQQAQAIYREALASARDLYNQKADYWRDFLARTLQIETPDTDLNRAFVWAKVSMEMGWVCGAQHSMQTSGEPMPSVPEQGFAFPGKEDCGLIAGYGPAGDGERPGFAWWFGGDGLMATWAMLDYGDFEGALRELRFLKSHQRADGTMMHEMTQSTGLVDWWGKYHFAYMHADTTPMYLYSLGQYWQRTGDRKFLEEFWPSAKLAYQYCVSTLDPADGLMDNTKSGLGAIEVGVLKGKVTKDIYVQGFWLAGLDRFYRLAFEMKDRSLYQPALEKRNKAIASLADRWWDPVGKYYSFGVDTAGKRVEMVGVWSSVLLALNPDIPHAKEAVPIFARPELATDWGTRWISDKSPLYDPLSYNNGTAWPFATGFTAWAQLRNGQPASAIQTLNSLVHLTGAQVPGGMPEHMVGNRNEPGARSVPRQLFSSWAMITPWVEAKPLVARANDYHFPDWSRIPTDLMGVEITPVRPRPERGAPNTSMKILNISSDMKSTVTIDLAGLARHAYQLQLYTYGKQVQVDGAKAIQKIESGYITDVLDIEFGPGDDYVNKTITIHY